MGAEISRGILRIPLNELEQRLKSAERLLHGLENHMRIAEGGKAKFTLYAEYCFASLLVTMLLLFLLVLMVKLMDWSAAMGLVRDNFSLFLYASFAGFPLGIQAVRYREKTFQAALFALKPGINKQAWTQLQTSIDQDQGLKTTVLHDWVLTEIETLRQKIMELAQKRAEVVTITDDGV